MAASERGCCVPRCGKTRKDDTVLHSFPNPDKEMGRYLAWTQAVGLDTSLDPHYVYRNRRVCHAHFELKFLTWTRRLSPGAVPTLLLPGSEMAGAPLVDIPSRSENVSFDAALPSTSRGSEMARAPLIDIPSRSENVSFDAALPSTSSRGPEMARAPLIDITNRPENVSFGAAVSSTSRGDTSSQETGQPKPKAKNFKLPEKKPMFDEKSFIKTIKKLQNKKDSYATRLKKALNLSENKTFINMLKKFTSLAAMFTLMQFREVGKHKMGRRFTEPEKIMTLSLYKRSPRVYRWLKNIFVLPSSMTLNRLIARANLKPGLNKNLFNQLKKRVQKMKSDEKLCILLFDEMSIAPHFEYNPRKDEISGFVNNGKSKERKLADHALVFMIRGIQKNYKQPVAYTFCSGSTSAVELARLIKEVIKELHDTGLRVLATVCDQGTTNVSAINSLIKQTKEKYIKKNENHYRDTFEVEDSEIIPLYDTPHLIKGIRNNLINKNLTCYINGSKKTAKWEHINKLYEEDPAYKGIRLVKKLSEHHVNPDKFQKMKVKYATQVFSQKVAVAMGFLAERNILPAECAQTADVILFFDELFDSMNGSFTNSKKRSGKKLLLPVTPKSDHGTVWSNAKKVLSTMKFISTDNQMLNDKVVPTVKNWLQTVNNVEYLIQKLFKNYNVKSVWMRHLNQDPLENFFGTIRSHGCRNTNPTVAGFESSFAASLINNLSGQHSPGSNCEEDNCQSIFNSMETLFEKSKNEPIYTDMIDINDKIFVPYEQKKNNPRVLATLQFVTGYLLKKAKVKVFKNCNKCKQCLYDPNNSGDFLKLREFKKGKTYLTYPHEKLVILFSKIQDLVTYIIKNKPMTSNLKSLIKTYLYTEIDFNLLDCESHKSQTVELIFDLSCNFFLHNWCRDVNKILNGTRFDLDDGDIIKMTAFNFYNKRKFKKPSNR